MKHLVYKLKRHSDGKEYIGITIDYRFHNRMSQHRNSDRFKNDSFDVEILFEDIDRNIVEEKENEFIDMFDTFENGLNLTKGGKGYSHDSSKFTTFNFKFSKKSRNKMSISAKRRGVPKSTIKALHSKDSREKRRKTITGKICFSKLTDDDINNIRNNFETWTNELIGTKARNGKLLTKERLFSRFIHKDYGVTEAAIYKVLTNQCLR